MVAFTLHLLLQVNIHRIPTATVYRWDLSWNVVTSVQDVLRLMDFGQGLPVVIGDRWNLQLNAGEMPEMMIETLAK